jgi:monoamine oxidase
VITRRQAIGAGVAVAAAAVVPAWALRARRRVVVVGAGMAGLAAATDARAAGWDVVVLEAGDRVGGRIRTLRGFAGGQVAEAGGEFLDAGHTVMRGYARRFGFALDDLYAVGSDNPACEYYDGRRRADPQVYDRAEERFYAAVDGASGADRSAQSVIDGLRLSAGARRYLEHAVVRDDYTVEARDLSIRFINGSADASGGQEERFRVRGGNDQVPQALADRLGSRVHLGARVTAIASDDDGVTVAAGDATFRADACVLAAPLPALRAIAFSPALPPRLASAVARLQYGTGTKVALQYADRPWRAQGFNGETLTDLPISSTWEATDAQRGPAGILLVYTVGAPGAALAALSDEERIAAAAADVARIYPGAEPIGAQTAAWEHTYAAYAPGQFAAYRDALRRPVGRIVLAGEHVSDLTAYMEGAARSGQRAAKLIGSLV